jgi:hypothetical protein
VERYFDVSSEASLENVISDNVCPWNFDLCARWLQRIKQTGYGQSFFLCASLSFLQFLL